MTNKYTNYLLIWLTMGDMVICETAEICENLKCLHAAEHEKAEDCEFGNCIFAPEGTCKCKR